MLLEGGDNVNTSEQLVSLIRDLIKEEISKKDASIICQIASVNENGTVNIILPSDPDTIIPNIKNTSGYEFVAGDYGVLYKIENKLNNSFIFSKIITTPPEQKARVIGSEISSDTLEIIGIQTIAGDTSDEVWGYGFKPIGNGYWESQNQKKGNSYSLCKIIFKGKGDLTLHCINESEPGWDYGIIGNINQVLKSDYTADSDVKESFKSTMATTTKDVVFNNIDTKGEEWFIMCKYLKDTSVDKGSDSLKFRLLAIFSVSQDDSSANYYVSKENSSGPFFVGKDINHL